MNLTSYCPKKFNLQRFGLGLGWLKDISGKSPFHMTVQESKGEVSPSPKQGHPWTRDSRSFGLEKTSEVDEAMKLVMENGRVYGVVVEREALLNTLKHVETRLLALEKEVAKLEGAHVQHSTHYIVLSQKVKMVEFLLSATNQAKSILDNHV